MTIKLKMSNWNKDKPYNDLPTLPPKIELETKEVLKKCVSARVALEGLRQAVALIPNPKLLIHTIPILEAQASSEIENIVTTTDTLFRFMDTPEKADPKTKEALRYRTALWVGLDSLKTCPISGRTAVAVCSALRNTNVDVRELPGTYIGTAATHRIVYTPPSGEEIIREKLWNWAEFLNENSPLDPLVRLPVAHYQFEAIHPFDDGNGRTGRVLNILYLVDQKLLDLPILYLSRYIIRHKSDYYARLLEVTKKGAWQPWILYMLEAIRDTAQWTCEKVLAIRALQEETVRTMKEDPKLRKIYSRELTDQIFSMPYTRINTLIEKKIGTRQTVAKYLDALVAAGILQEAKTSKARLFLNARLLDLLLS